MRVFRGQAASVEAAFVEAETVEAASVEAKCVESSPLTTSPLTASSSAQPPLLGASLSLARSSSSPFKISAAALFQERGAILPFGSKRRHGRVQHRAFPRVISRDDGERRFRVGGVRRRRLRARASRSASRRRSNAVAARAPPPPRGHARDASTNPRDATIRAFAERRVPDRQRQAISRRQRVRVQTRANCRSVSDAREGENENVDDDAAPSPSPDDATDHTASHVTWRVDSPIEPLLFHTAARRACAIAATASSATRRVARPRREIPTK